MPDSSPVNRFRLPRSLYWLCVVGPTFGTMELLLLVNDARRQHTHFLHILMVGGTGVFCYILYRSVRLVRDGLQLRALLRQDREPEAQTETVQRAKNRAQDFFRVTFGTGLAIAVLRLFLGK